MKNKDLLTLIKKTTVQKSTLHILRKVLVNRVSTGIEICATNLDIFTSVIFPCDYYGHLESFIADITFIELLMKHNFNVIEVISDTTIRVNNVVLQINADASEFPTAMIKDHKKSGNPFVTTSKVLHDFSWYTSNDLARPVINAVYLDKERNAIAATDGHVMRVKNNAGTNVLDSGVLIHRGLIKILPKNENISIYRGCIEMKSATIIFKASDDDTYPNYPNAIPEMGAMKYKLIVNLKELETMLPMVNKRTKQVVFVKDEKTVTIVNDDHVYEMISSHINENPYKVSMNLEYLIHILKDAGTDTLLTQEPRDKTSDCILGATIALNESTNETFLLMPLRVSEGK